MKYLLGVLSLFLFMGCAHHQISPYFKYNDYKSDFYTHVFNDSLKLYMRSFGDVDITTKKRALHKQLRKETHNFDHVLIYGKTFIDPYYEYYLLVDSENKWTKDERISFRRDTVISGKRLTFIGISLDDSNPKKDFESIYRTLSGGAQYRKALALHKERLTARQKGNLMTINSVLSNSYKTNTYLKSYKNIVKAETFEKEEEGVKLQMQLTYASFMGQNDLYNQLLKKWEIGDVNDTVVTTILDEGENGLKNIQQGFSKKLENQRLVMFNENHFYPNHRVLVAELLPELKKAGFNYLALEALSLKSDKPLNKGKDVSLSTGFYTREQNFVELIRKAQSLGIQLVAYENEDGKKNREEGEAENLFKKTFAKDKNAKVIVLAGIAHIYEKPDSRNKKWMACIFKENYKINPLTFSQTTLNRYNNLVEEVKLIKSKRFHLKRCQTTDYQIINNISFRKSSGSFSYTNKHKFPVQVAVFKENVKNFKLSVPVRSFLLRSNETYFTDIDLKTIRLVIYDDKGAELENRIINFHRSKN